MEGTVFYNSTRDQVIVLSEEFDDEGIAEGMVFFDRAHPENRGNDVMIERTKNDNMLIENAPTDVQLAYFHRVVEFLSEDIESMKTILTQITS
mgnify:CR=1 FL=1